MAQACSSLNDNSTLGTEEFIAAIYEEPGTILDVRPTELYNQQHVSEALNLPVANEEEFRQKIATLSRKDVYYIYCNDGVFSHKAVKIMREAGFQQVFELKGGLAELESSGYAVAGL
jgi:rhodanese-related sulfurtransferase